MASPVGDSFGCASGGVIAAGRYRFPANARISIWGQSNGVGYGPRSDLSTTPLSTDSGLATYDAGTFDRVFIWNGSIYAKLNPAVNNGANTACFGPEFGIAVRWMRETTSGNLFIDKETSGGQSISYWAPSSGNYAGAKVREAARKSWLSTNGFSGAQVSGWFWIQGESDRFQTQDWYQTRLADLMAALIADGFTTASAKNVLAKMPVGSATYGATVSAAKDAIAGSTANTSVIDMPGYLIADNIHLNARGQVQTAYDTFERIFGAPHITV